MCLVNLFNLLCFAAIGVRVSCVGFETVDQCRIFCNGELLRAMQSANIFQDSKDFVDMPLRYSPNVTLQAFEQLDEKSEPEVLQLFIAKFFLPPGNELEVCDPKDWQPRPATLNKIRDPEYREWAYKVHSKWKKLCRKVKSEVLQNPERYSLLPLPYPFIVPGGRFREFYYWDTYWIVKGLLRSEMFQMAKYVLLNLLETVRQYGFIPNGGRVYYLKRTQPPMLASTVLEYFKATNDVALIAEILPFLEDEYHFFETNRSVTWYSRRLRQKFQLFQYRVEQDAPRPESYKEDIETAAHAASEMEKIQIWSDIAAACESGWDFSSRWFAKRGKYKDSLKGIRTSRIVPVDLNAFMVMNTNVIAKLFDVVGNRTKSNEYKAKYAVLSQNLMKLFWNDTDGSWLDLDLETGKQSHYYYASNLTPLFAKCVPSNYYYERTVQYLSENDATSYIGGLPTTLTFIDEQWDNPNGWAPTNHMAIEGLRRSVDPEVQELAFQLAEKWVSTNYLAYLDSGGKMFEKYNIQAASSGGGGEYEVQEGFGWTNGVLLDLLVTYGDRLRAPRRLRCPPMPDPLVGLLESHEMVGFLESLAFVKQNQ